MVTVILLNWKRPKNIPVILEALNRQTLRPQIWLINCGEKMRGDWDEWIDVSVNISGKDFGNYIRLYYGAFVETKYIMYLDDDLCPMDDEFVQDAVNLAEKNPDCIVTGWGKGIDRKPYYVDEARREGERRVIAKTKFLIFNRKLLDRVPIRATFLTKEFMKRSDDAYLSIMIGGGKPVHYVSTELRQRLERLPEGEVGLDQDSLHIKIREKFMEYFYKYRNKKM